MGGSAGGIIPDAWTTGQVEKKIKHAEKQAFEAGFKTELSELLGELLRQFNDRDTDTVNHRLDQIKAFLTSELDSSIDQLFGGSVAKHTYVDGLSDVDTLFVLDSASVDVAKPVELVDDFASLVSTRLGQTAEVTAGDMAVTVEYPDGMEIQILPAFKDANGNLQISSGDMENWSRIAPLKFQEVLSRRNKECNGKLIPVIKLAKAVLATLPKTQQLSGYHVESLAVEAFKNYGGPTTNSEMLVEFFDRAKTLVNTPIRDKTGQSIHLDDYLGPAKSPDRVKLSYLLGRIEKRMRNASAASSIEKWSAIFGLDEL